MIGQTAWQFTSSRTRRRGSVIVIVIWSVAVMSLVVSSLQLFGFRQAVYGREVVGRVQARWAARAGVENTIAMLVSHTENPVEDDRLAMIRDLEYVAIGELLNAGYDIRHHRDGRDWYGPLDEHSRINLHMASAGNLRNMLLSLEDMTEDVIDSIGDWQDADDDVSLIGAEREYYAHLSTPYEPRNEPVRSVAELNLVAGVDEEYLRGEDWNLNNRLDPNENDGRLTWPEHDNADDQLRYGWAGFVTVWSVGNGATESGKPRIRLGLAEAEELADRIGVDTAKANELISFGLNPSATLDQLVASAGNPTSSPGTAAQQPGFSRTGRSRSRSGSATPGATGSSQQPVVLSEPEFAKVFNETMIEGQYTRVPGKINLNTVSVDLLRRIMDAILGDESLADEIIYLRNTQPGGILSIMDLKKIPILNNPGASTTLQRLSELFTTTSNVFTISCKGRSWSTGQEVEIIAVVDRSTLPIRILEYREQ